MSCALEDGSVVITAARPAGHRLADPTGTQVVPPVANPESSLRRKWTDQALSQAQCRPQPAAALLTRQTSRGGAGDILRVCHHARPVFARHKTAKSKQIPPPHAAGACHWKRCAATCPQSCVTAHQATIRTHYIDDQHAHNPALLRTADGVFPSPGI